MPAIIQIPCFDLEMNAVMGEQREDHVVLFSHPKGRKSGLEWYSDAMLEHLARDCVVALVGAIGDSYNPSTITADCGKCQDSGIWNWRINAYIDCPADERTS